MMNDIENKRKYIINSLWDNTMVEFVSVPIDRIDKWFEGAWFWNRFNKQLFVVFKNKT